MSMPPPKAPATYSKKNAVPATPRTMDYDEELTPTPTESEMSFREPGQLQKVSALMLIREFASYNDDAVTYDPVRQGFNFNHIFLSQWEPVGYKDLQGEDYNLGSIWYFTQSWKDDFEPLGMVDREKRGIRNIDVEQMHDLMLYLLKKTKSAKYLVGLDEMPFVDCPVNPEDVPSVKKGPKPGSDAFELEMHMLKEQTCMRKLRWTEGCERERTYMERARALAAYSRGQKPRTGVPMTPQKRTREQNDNLADVALEACLEAKRFLMTRRKESYLAKKMKQRAEIIAGGSLLERITSKGKDPIIIVPSNPRALINVQNIKALLERGEYMSPNPSLWSTRARQVEVVKKIGSKDVKFRVVDSVQKFSHDDWKCCVACIIDGKEWQFKGWPFDHYSALFQTMAGIHIGLDDDPNCADVAKKWKVLLLQLRRNTRHEDGAMTRKVWNYITEFMTKSQVRALNFNAKLKPGVTASN